MHLQFLQGIIGFDEDDDEEGEDDDEIGGQTRARISVRVRHTTLVRKAVSLNPNPVVAYLK